MSVVFFVEDQIKLLSFLEKCIRRINRSYNIPYIFEIQNFRVFE